MTGQSQGTSLCSSSQPCPYRSVETTTILFQSTWVVGRHLVKPWDIHKAPATTWPYWLAPILLVLWFREEWHLHVAFYCPSADVLFLPCDKVAPLEIQRYIYTLQALGCVPVRTSWVVIHWW